MQTHGLRQWGVLSRRWRFSAVGPVLVRWPRNRDLIRFRLKPLAFKLAFRWSSPVKWWFRFRQKWFRLKPVGSGWRRSQWRQSPVAFSSLLLMAFLVAKTRIMFVTGRRQFGLVSVL